MVINHNALSVTRYHPNDVDILHSIVAKCGADMKNRFGLIHWSPPYPLEIMRKHAYERDVYGVHYDSQAIGTFTIGTNGWNYDPSLWIDPSHKSLYLGKLAVLPEYQGCGVGSWCLQKIEEIASQLHSQTIRFDSISKLTHLTAFYQKRGYIPRGQRTIIDWRGTAWEVVYFEKAITQPGQGVRFAFNFCNA